MNVVFTALINTAIATLIAFLSPQVQIEHPVYLILAMAVASYVITGVSPNLLAFDRKVVILEFIFMYQIVALPIYLIVLAITPGTTTQGFMTGVIISVITGIPCGIMQRKNADLYL